MSLEILQFVCSRYGFILPVGSSFCYNHLRSESASFRAPSISPVKSLVQQRTPTDSNYHPEEIILSSDVTENAQASGSSLSDILDASPIQYQIKQKKVEELSENTKQLLKGKFIRFKQQLEKKFAEAIAPGQSDELIQTVLLNDQLSSDSDGDDMLEDLKVSTSIYAESDSLGKSIIISLVDHQKHTKDDI